MKRLLYLITCIITLPALAQDANTINITTTAVPFLRISPDARTGGMGEAGIAAAEGPAAAWYNRAALAFATPKAAVTAGYTPWMRNAADDMYLATLAGYTHINSKGTVSASLRYFSLGNVALTDYYGNKLSSSSPREFAADLGYSLQLTPKWAVAVAGRFIHSRLASGNFGDVAYRSGKAVAADLSVLYNGMNEDNNGWRAGFVINNLGSRIAYTDNAAEKDFLPANMGAGVAYTETSTEGHAFTLAFDVNKLLVPTGKGQTLEEYHSMGLTESWARSFKDAQLTMAIGGEYAYRNIFRLRTGFNSRSYAAGQWQSLTAGLGVNLGPVEADLSYTLPLSGKMDTNPMYNTLRIGVSYSWK